MKEEDQVFFTCECNSDEIPMAVCLKTVAEGVLQVGALGYFYPCLNPNGSGRELGMFNELRRASGIMKALSSLRRPVPALHCGFLFPLLMAYVR